MSEVTSLSPDFPIFIRDLLFFFGRWLEGLRAAHYVAKALRLRQEREREAEAAAAADALAEAKANRQAERARSSAKREQIRAKWSSSGKLGQ